MYTYQQIAAIKNSIGCFNDNVYVPVRFFSFFFFLEYFINFWFGISY